MIYTCTTNPSLDYYVSFEKLIKGKNNRSDMEIYDAGGKGVNVSIVLNNLQIKTSCLGFLGGFTKDYYLSHISKYPFIQPLFTSIKDNTRINVKIMETECETSLNAKGPNISDEEFDRFSKRLNNIYADDIFVLSGSIENEIEDRMIKCVEELSNSNVRIVVDSEPQIIDKCLKYKPLLVKLNDKYNIYNKDQLFIQASKLLDMGCQYVMYSEVNKESYLFNKDEILMVKSLEGGLQNTTGSGDSMVAGFLYAKLRCANNEELLKYANAASLVSSLSNDLTCKERIEEAFNNIEVIKVK